MEKRNDIAFERFESIVEDFFGKKKKRKRSYCKPPLLIFGAIDIDEQQLIHTYRVALPCFGSPCDPFMYGILAFVRTVIHRIEYRLDSGAFNTSDYRLVSYASILDERSTLDDGLAIRTLSLIYEKGNGDEVAAVEAEPTEGGRVFWRKVWDSKGASKAAIIDAEHQRLFERDEALRCERAAARKAVIENNKRRKREENEAKREQAAKRKRTVEDR
jgi:hypothetical protein